MKKAFKILDKAVQVFSVIWGLGLIGFAIWKMDIGSGILGFFLLVVTAQNIAIDKLRSRNLELEIALLDSCARNRALWQSNLLLRDDLGDRGAFNQEKGE